MFNSKVDAIVKEVNRIIAADSKAKILIFSCFQGEPWPLSIAPPPHFLGGSIFLNTYGSCSDTHALPFCPLPFSPSVLKTPLPTSRPSCLVLGSSSAPLTAA